MASLLQKRADMLTTNDEQTSLLHPTSLPTNSIGPGINPKVAASRNGTHSRVRSTASEPPIVNTGNSGPMCVQAGDWICTGCGFVVSSIRDHGRL